MTCPPPCWPLPPLSLPVTGSSSVCVFLWHSLLIAEDEINENTSFSYWSPHTHIINLISEAKIVTHTWWVWMRWWWKESRTPAGVIGEDPVSSLPDPMALPFPCPWIYWSFPELESLGQMSSLTFLSVIFLSGSFLRMALDKFQFLV